MTLLGVGAANMPGLSLVFLTTFVQQHKVTSYLQTHERGLSAFSSRVYRFVFLKASKLIFKFFLLIF